MRVHVTAKGKATSISISETLMDYLGAKAVRNKPRYHSDAERQLKLAKEAVQTFVRTDDTLPDEDLSQYVQKQLIRNIADPALTAILDARGPRKPAVAQKKAPADPAAVAAVLAKVRRDLG